MKIPFASESFDCLDVDPLHRCGECETGKDRLSVGEDCAGSAFPCIASDLRASQLKLLAQNLCERPLRLDGELMLLAVNV